MKVLVPAVSSGVRTTVDLWLCGHHYRASQSVLSAAGAVVEELAVAADQTQPDRTAVTA